MEYYAYLNGAQRGPFTEEQMRAYLADGLLQPSDLVSNQAGADWKTLASHERFSAAAVSKSVPQTAPDIPAQRTSPPAVPVLSLGPYARATLAPNETPYFKTSLHWIVFVRFAFVALLVFLIVAMPFAIGVQALTASQLGWFVLPLPAFIMVPPTLAYVSSELVVTDRRVLIKTGVIRRQTLEMFIAKVESIAVDQGFLGRALDFGTVSIRGTGGSEEPFEAIAHPIQFRNWVQQLQHSETSIAAR